MYLKYTKYQMNAAIFEQQFSTKLSHKYLAFPSGFFNNYHSHDNIILMVLLVSSVFLFRVEYDR